MEIIIQGKSITLSPQDVIGVGGEATVFRHAGTAVKVYGQPSSERANKIQVLLSHVHLLPDNAIAPQALVYTPDGIVAGFSMPLLSSNATEIRQIASRNYRRKHGIRISDVIAIFLDIQHTLDQIHSVGMVVGDLNDLNIMFKGAQSYFIDVDSFQFDRFPCPVGTEEFIDPQLYNVDLNSGPVYSRQTDWYAYLVLLFKSLLMAHPYGGTHHAVHTLTQRAVQGISVLNTSVTYPKIALPLATLSDDLLELCTRWFNNRQRGIFPLRLLHDYQGSLVECHTCSMMYPRERKHCPVCSELTVIPATKVFNAELLLETSGTILACFVQGARLSVIACEDEQDILYSYEGNGEKRIVIGSAMLSANYALMGQFLVISYPDKMGDLALIDLNQTPPTLFCNTHTDHFGGRHIIFGANEQSLYRVAGGYLLRGEVRYHCLVEQPVLAIASNQTWFKVAPEENRVLGFFRTFDQYKYWMLHNHSCIDVDIPRLERGETLLEIDVQFTPSGAILLRKTKLNGIVRTIIDEVYANGTAVHHLVISASMDFELIACGPGVLIHVEDEVIVQHRLDNGQTRRYPQQPELMKHVQGIARFDDGLLLITEKQIRRLIP